MARHNQCVKYFIFIFILLIQPSTMTGIFPQPGSSIPMTYNDSVKFCNDQPTKPNVSLAFPKDQDEENKLISQIGLTPATTCRFIYYAHKASSAPRYLTTSGESYRTLTWMMDYMPSVKPNFHPIMLRFRVKILPDVEFDASKRRGQNLLMLSKTRPGKDCENHPYQCGYVYRSKPTYDFSTAYKRALQENPNFYTIVLYDVRQSPENLEVENFTSGDVLVSNVKYSFEYKFNNKDLRYKSHRFLVKDPEYDCLVYDRMRDRLVTYRCDDLACPACVGRVSSE